MLWLSRADGENVEEEKIMGAQFNSSAVTAVLLGAYKTFQSTGDAVAWRVNALGKPAMTQLAMDRGLCIGSLCIAIQTVLAVTLHQLPRLHQR
ncbi:hypothetical protein N7499_004002 [Penicillium canescens]|uniref:Uncharacterized protein n=1 Tax=Penicillium canescens TaxID=5083 RepID=A0AAD6IM99_PENCN|nr:uncharacterized protein N7446_007513 [Penicillium canescens]KAJ5991586.1 hypothetical protein N7522_011793 [Penicillium canescens]KAJ6049160.1 hypothetical protein N7444_005876 [Penicillium canescens]KAJ6052868.1 hypothetical protein N7460_003402 [Penicillium canescens]KAJ6063393.1 hypothetical protein N7446_007513 [Penicillium canescens]KAJ6089155.1 hypothetical protein N7499_004002 [Penicillium canescens]